MPGIETDRTTGTDTQSGWVTGRVRSSRLADRSIKKSVSYRFLDFLQKFFVYWSKIYWNLLLSVRHFHCFGLTYTVILGI